METRTFDRRARQRHTKTHQNRRRPAATLLEGPSVAANRDVIASVAGRLPASHLTNYTAHVSLTRSSTRRWRLDFATSDNTVVACAISVTPPRDPYPCARQSMSVPSELPRVWMCWQKRAQPHRAFHHRKSYRNHPWRPRPGFDRCC